jgi:hydroxymethylbilane synthase
MTEIAIATRGSALARWQANYVRSALLARCGDVRIELKVIRTTGDEELQAPAHGAIDKGMFTSQIEDALLTGSVSLAVHSLKDLPTQLPDGLVIAAVTARSDPADVLVSKGGLTLDDLPEGAKVLTGSVRRRAQLLHRRADLKISPVRGNVETRLRKLDESDARAIVLARAGLERLGLTQRLEPAEFLPACGQGALAVEVRSDDIAARELLAPLDDPASRLAVTAERGFLAALGGGCRLPVGAYARFTDEATLTLTGILADLDGSRLLKQTICCACADAEAAGRLGARLADKLPAAERREILDEVLNAGDRLWEERT